MNLLPDDFRTDPYGYATNQISHFALGLSVALMLSLVFSIGVAILIYSVGYVVWELVQYFVHGAGIKDCIEDISFSLLGAVTAYFVMPIALIIIGIAVAILISGISKRS